MWLFLLAFYAVVDFRLSCGTNESEIYFAVGWTQLQFGQTCQLFCAGQADPGESRSQSKGTQRVQQYARFLCAFPHMSFNFAFLNFLGFGMNLASFSLFSPDHNDRKIFHIPISPLDT